MTACTDDKDNPFTQPPGDERRSLLEDSCHGLAVASGPARATRDTDGQAAFPEDRMDAGDVELILVELKSKPATAK